MVCKIFSRSNFPKRIEKSANARRFAFQANAKIALLRASMAITYYIKLFRTGVDRYSGILMSLLLLFAETKIFTIFFKKYFLLKYISRIKDQNFMENDVND